MANITDLAVSLNVAEEQQNQAQGFRKIDVNLNKGAGGARIFLWYKKQCGQKAITKIQFTFNTAMADGLVDAGYTKINKNLNAGAGGSQIFLWYFRGSGEFQTPITDITVTADGDNEAGMFGLGLERLACDLNRGIWYGNWIHLWLKRENQTYICDVSATDSYGADSFYFKEGYTRVDETTNRGAGGAPVFIWYRQTTKPKKAVNDLQVSICDFQYQQYQQQGYQLVNINLNEGTRGSKVYMWYKKGSGTNPIKDVILLLNICLAPQFEKAGVTVIRKNVNTGNDDGWWEYLCYYNV